MCREQLKLMYFWGPVIYQCELEGEHTEHRKTTELKDAGGRSYCTMTVKWVNHETPTVNEIVPAKVRF